MYQKILLPVMHTQSTGTLNVVFAILTDDYLAFQGTLILKNVQDWGHCHDSTRCNEHAASFH